MKTISLRFHLHILATALMLSACGGAQDSTSSVTDPVTVDDDADKAEPAAPGPSTPASVDDNLDEPGGDGLVEEPTSPSMDDDEADDDDDQDSDNDSDDDDSDDDDSDDDDADDW